MAHDLLEHNPMLIKPVICLLTLMRENPHMTRAQLENAANEQWQDSFARTPSVVFDILIRNGIVDEQILIDGKPYDGNLEDAMTDFDIPEDADVECRIEADEAAHDILRDYASENMLRALFDERPYYEDIYCTVLRTCAHAGGATRSDIENAIKDKPQLLPDPESKQTLVYPQYFIDTLETNGGIVWDGIWHTTEAGRLMLP